MLDKEVLYSVGTPTLPIPGRSRVGHEFPVAHLPTNVLRHLGRSPSIRSRDNLDRRECQEIEGHTADLIVLPSWCVVEILVIPHKFLINKKGELDGSKSSASSFVKLHTFSHASVRVFSKTQSPNAHMWPPSNSHNCIRQDLEHIKLCLEVTSTIELPRNFFRDDSFAAVSWYGISSFWFARGTTTRRPEFVLCERFYGNASSTSTRNR